MFDIAHPAVALCHRYVDLDKMAAEIFDKATGLVQMISAGIGHLDAGQRSPCVAHLHRKTLVGASNACDANGLATAATRGRISDAKIKTLAMAAQLAHHASADVTALEADEVRLAEAGVKVRSRICRC